MKGRALHQHPGTWGRRDLGFTTVAYLFLATASVSADPVRGIRSAVIEPIAIRGGVLMVPLTAQRPGDGWPERLTLTLADQRRVEGEVVWVHPIPVPMRRHWTEDPRRLGVRRIQPTDDTSVGEGGAPYLLAHMPSDGQGVLRLRRQTLRPQWHDPPVRAGLMGATSAHRGALALAEAADRPDPHSPFEYWRWVMLAHRLEMSAPSPLAYGEIGSMVAQHYADLWQLGLSRLGTLSPGVVDACRDLLTQTCRDHDQSFAVWVADPTELNSLLGLLLDLRSSDRRVMQSALAWADATDLRLVWPQGADRDRVTVAIANPTFDPVVAQFTWRGADHLTVATRLEPAVLTRVHVDRPISPPPKPAVRTPLNTPESIHETLLVEINGRAIEITLRRGALMARPPGVLFAPLRAPLTLAEAQAHKQLAVPPDRSTLVQLRRLNRRWEIFLECRRPTPPASEADLAACADFHDTRGIEAVTLLIGPENPDGGPTVVLTVPELGWRRLFVGSNDGTLQIHRRSYADRWYCRLVMPERWMAGRMLGRVELGFVRTHGDSDAVEAGPNTTVPWQLDPGRVAVDISSWADVPLDPVPPRGGQTLLGPGGRSQP